MYIRETLVKFILDASVPGVDSLTPSSARFVHSLDNQHFRLVSFFRFAVVPPFTLQK